LSVDKKKPIYFFPLVVTNKPVEIGEREITLTITYQELKAIDFSKELQMDSMDKSSNSVEIQIRGRKTIIPLFSAFP